MDTKNSIINQFFSVDGIEKVTISESSNVYKKDALNKFMVKTFPQYVENGAIAPSKYDKVVTKARKKLRILLLEVLEMFKAQKTNESKRKFALEFAKFYSEFYILNDYSLASVTNGRMKEDSMNLIQECLPQLKSLLEEQKSEKKSEKKK